MLAGREDAFKYGKELKNLLEALKEKGRSALVVKALLDPNSTVAIWRTEAGKVQIAEKLPSAVPQQRIIAVDSGADPLVLGAEQAIAIGMGKACKGTSQELGKLLGLKIWKPAGVYGRQAMRRAAIEVYQERKRWEARKEAHKRQIIQARIQTKAEIEYYLEVAKALDPERFLTRSQKLHFSRWEWIWGGRGLVPTVTRIRWRALTDEALWALCKARKAIRTMQALEEEAASLGLKPLYSQEELQKLLIRTAVRIKYLVWYRSRRTRSA